MTQRYFKGILNLSSVPRHFRFFTYFRDVAFQLKNSSLYVLKFLLHLKNTLYNSENTKK